MGGGSTLTGVLVAGGFALAGAIVAAVTAGLRQRAQLTHERELRDLDELRKLVDDTSEFFSSVRSGLENAAELKAVAAAYEYAYEESQRFDARLSVRIGDDTELGKALTNMTEKLQSVATAKSQLPGNRPDALWKEYDEAMEEYYAAARRLIGTRLPAR